MTDQYTQAPITSCPPLTTLQTYGICCPFLESELESEARACIQNLKRYPITWYRHMRVSEVTEESVRGAHEAGLMDRQTSQRVVEGAGSFIDGMLGMVDDILGTSSKTEAEKADVPLTCVGVKAELSVVDTRELGPVIVVQQTEEDDGDGSSQCEHDDDESRFFADCLPTILSDPNQKNPLPSKIIPLYKTYSVSRGYSLFDDPTSGGVKLYGRPASFLSNGEELLRFDTLGGEGGVKDAIFPIKSKSNKYCDEVIRQLRALVDWNRRRIARDVKRGRVGVAENNGSVIAES